MEAGLCTTCLVAQRTARQKLKAEVVGTYGGKCACCGEDRLPFLTIDHVNNDGAAHRRELFGRSRGAGGEKMYRWLKKSGYPSEFQALCYNCNIAKHQNGGVCPHAAIT